MNSLIGKILENRYRVDTYIGRGGMADVYKVWDSQRAVFLAMKVLHADLAEDKIFLRRFKREAETLATLQHPHIVRFYGLEQDKSMSFILMDYVDGTTLRKLIFEADDTFPAEQMLTIMRPVCSALHYAHKMGRAHCDIKPANIMVRDNGDVLVADFGIARMMDAATATMVGAGTPAYMAPEQVRGDEPIPQTDIYALGIVLYEMLTGGERPFTGEGSKTTGSTSEKVRWEQLNLDPPSPKKWNPDLSAKMEALVVKCLEKDPEKRFQTPLELLNALEVALTEKAKAGSSLADISALEYDGTIKNNEQIEKKQEVPAREGLVSQLEIKAPGEKKVQNQKKKIVIWAMVGLLVVASGLVYQFIGAVREVPPEKEFVTEIVFVEITSTPISTYTQTPVSQSSSTATATAVQIYLKTKTTNAWLKAGPHLNHHNVSNAYSIESEFEVLCKYKVGKEFWYNTKSVDNGTIGWLQEDWVSIGDREVLDLILECTNPPTPPAIETKEKDEPPSYP